MYDLARAPSQPGPTTPTSLVMGVNFVEIATRFDGVYTPLLGGTATNNAPVLIDVVKQTGLPGNAFGAGTVKDAEYKAIHMILSGTGTYSGPDPCSDGEASVTDAAIQLPGGGNGTVTMNFMEPHPVTGMQRGYIQIQHFDVGSDPLEFRLVYNASNSVVCSSGAAPLQTISGSGLSVPEGIAFIPDPGNDPTKDEVAVSNNNINTVEIFNTSDGSLVGTIGTGGAGDTTGLSNPFGIYSDPGRGQIGVANSGNDSITIYDLTAHAAPKLTIVGDAGNDLTQLNSPGGIAYDSVHDEIVVANGGDNSVNVYNRTTLVDDNQHNNASPVARLARDFAITAGVNDTISLTELLSGGEETHPIAQMTAGAYATGDDLAAAVNDALAKSGATTSFNVTYDSTSDLFTIAVVTLAQGVSSVMINWEDPATTAAGVLGYYPVNSGPLFPGALYISDYVPSGLNVPCGIYVDSVNNEIGVANSGNNTVTIYTESFDQNGIPALSLNRTISGPKTGLNNPCGIYVDVDADPTKNHNEIGVANNGNDSITIYDRSLSGNVAPKRTVIGGSTGISAPVGIYLDRDRDEIGVADSSNNTVTIHPRNDPTVQLSSLPVLIISPVEQALFPKYYFSGTIDSAAGNGNSASVAFGGYSFDWKVTDSRIRSVSDTSNATLIPPNNIVFGLTDGHFASTLDLVCPRLTPFIILERFTNCTPPRILLPAPVVGGSYKVPATAFKATSISTLTVNPSPLSLSEFPRPVPTLTLGTPGTNNKRAIQSIGWSYVDGTGLPLTDPPPLIFSQDVQIQLQQSYKDVNPTCYTQVQGNSLQLVFDSGSLASDVRAVPGDPNQVINNNRCPVYLEDVADITFALTDALGEQFEFDWQPQ